jgi:uncharacterized protein (DUF1697 family)
MVYVALFRNLNLGHRGSPDRAQLVDAFAAADSVRSFQTNGTVLFAADDPEQVVAHAVDALEGVGYRDRVIVRPLDELRGVVTSTSEARPEEQVYRTTLSFFDAPAIAACEPPLRSPNGLVEIRRLEQRWAAGVCWQRGTTIGDVNAFLERLLGSAVTTRTLGTLQRLLAAAAQR